LDQIVSLFGIVCIRLIADPGARFWQFDVIANIRRYDAHRLANDVHHRMTVTKFFEHISESAPEFLKFLNRQRASRHFQHHAYKGPGQNHRFLVHRIVRLATLQIIKHLFKCRDLSLPKFAHRFKRHQTFTAGAGNGEAVDDVGVIRILAKPLEHGHRMACHELVLGL